MTVPLATSLRYLSRSFQCGGSQETQNHGIIKSNFMKSLHPEWDAEIAEQREKAIFLIQSTLRQLIYLKVFPLHT